MPTFHSFPSLAVPLHPLLSDIPCPDLPSPSLLPSPSTSFLSPPLPLPTDLGRRRGGQAMRKQGIWGWQITRQKGVGPQRDSAVLGAARPGVASFICGQHAGALPSPLITYSCHNFYSPVYLWDASQSGCIHQGCVPSVWITVQHPVGVQQMSVHETKQQPPRGLLGGGGCTERCPLTRIGA